MKKPLRYGIIGLAALAVAAPLVANATAGAEEPVGEVGTAAVTELVANGGFDNGATGWWNGPNTTMSVGGGVLNVQVTGTPANYWDAPMGQDGLKLENGKAYTVSFDAKASKAVSVRSTVQLNVAPYTAPHDKVVALTTTSKRFSYTFTSNIATTAGQVGFQLGRNGAFTFSVDNISVTTETATQPSGEFYVDPDNNAYTWIDQNQGDPDRATIESNIASKAGAKWFGSWMGETEGAIRESVNNYVTAATNAGKTPILAAYNIYGRDCGGYSEGGPETPGQYEDWIRGFADGIGARKAIVIVEPDAVAQAIDCDQMTPENLAIRRHLLTYATEQLKTRATGAWSYLDAGNAGWLAPSAMAAELQQAGIANTRGFAVNVSNYKSTAASNTYASQVNQLLPTSKKWIVDTSRNGSANTDGDWCNSRGSKLGATSQVGSGGAEYFLWVKFPGDSDGECTHAGHNDPRAGDFVERFALALISGNWAGV
ncbi:glycoside hydrolase family 6 protein [Phytomonospora sp. NPDC050363]|uniref:glycoside hydrolase family 6 protein n=1 Tax=Phytomonospora sp. NPDC050363 TaxID=3155642 RepID=UPI0033E11642